MERRRVVVSAFTALAMAFVILAGVAIVNTNTIDIMDDGKTVLSYLEEQWWEKKTEYEKLKNQYAQADTNQRKEIQNEMAELDKDMKQLKHNLEILPKRTELVIAFSWVQFIVAIVCCALAIDQLIYEATSRILCTISAIMSVLSVLTMAIIYLVLYAEYKLSSSISYALLFVTVVMLAVTYWLKYENRN